jgi:hypothetical protein
MAHLVNGYTFDSPPTAAEVEFFQYCNYDYVEKNPEYVDDTYIIKLLDKEIAITTANTVSNATLIRVINTGDAGILNITYSNGVVYANATITNNEIAYIEKISTDMVVGANMKAVPIEFNYIKTFISYVGVYFNANGALSSPYVANNEVEQY